MNVLEHLPNPERAIANLATALRRRGVMVLGFPNPLSVKGLATKFTPHFVHVFILKKFFNYAKAGEKGYAPFPTYLRFALAAKSVAKRLRESGLDVVFLWEFEGNQPLKLREKSRMLYTLYRSACAMADILTLRSFRSSLSETLVIARRQ